MKESLSLKSSISLYAKNQKGLIELRKLFYSLKDYFYYSFMIPKNLLLKTLNKNQDDIFCIMLKCVAERYNCQDFSNVYFEYSVRDLDADGNKYLFCQHNYIVFPASAHNNNGFSFKRPKRSVWFALVACNVGLHWMGGKGNNTACIFLSF